jgi:CHAT domain-containing protein
VEKFAKRALAVVEKSLGKENPDTAKVVRKLGVAYDGQRRYAEAEMQFNRALAIFTKAFGPDHRFVATVLISQGHLFEHQGRHAEAEQVYKRALTINEKARGMNHPDVARGLNDLALLSISRDKPDDAIAYSRKATAAILAQADGDVSAGKSSSGGSDGVIEQRSGVFVTHVAGLAAAAARTGNDSARKLGQEAFEMAQWAIQSSAGAALQQLGPRFAAGNDALAALVRANQDLSAYLRDRNKALVAALSNPDGPSNAAKIEEIRKHIADTERKLAANSAQLQDQFPEFAKLNAPKPLQIDDVQKVLGPDEALVLLLTGDKQSYVFALTDNAFDWHTIPVAGGDLATEIEQFRKGLDVDQLQTFDLDLAYRLFGQLIGPVDGLVKNKSHLVVVSSGTLTALPFHLLVTEKPAKASLPLNGKSPEQDAAPYRDAAWLIKRQAVTVLPSVASLRTLRSFPRREMNQKPMIGFGDPIFSQESAPGNNRDAARTRGARSYTEYWRGAGLDRSALASAPRLPDTADELRAVASNLGAANSDIHLRRDASVTTVKRAPLEDFRIVYFATHGLVAGDVKGLAEPALLLSLPASPNPDDTGLLTASEAAQLKLNADWVVLSACNTAAGERPGAPALSGLARAFFYAGARALLVSHWPVATEAATRLTTSTFDTLKTDPKLGRAEGLRRAMLAYLADRSSPTNAHPAYWGPFALVGEGARR